MFEIVDWRPYKATTNFVVFICLSLNSIDKTMGQRPPPSSSPCAPSHLTYIPQYGSFLVGCCILPSSRSHQNLRPNHPLYFLFFIALLNLPPKTMSKPPPPRVPPVRISSPTPCTPPTPLFGWLLCRSIEQRASKTSALPISQLFDGRHFVAQNKVTDMGEPNPSRRSPLLGSWGAVAP